MPNDGLLVYLYDDAALASLREVGSSLVHGDEDDPEWKRVAKRLTLARSLVRYELVQDDELHVGVVVGPPLTAKEKRGLPWLRPASSVLRLPSGRLCVESTNTLRFDEDGAEPGGAIVEVPPGEYVVTLHRVDWLKLDEYDGPTEIVTLTPAAEVARLPPCKLHLAVPVPKGPKRPPVRDDARAAAARELDAVIGLLEVKADMSLSALDVDLPEHRALMAALGATRDRLLAGAADEPVPASLVDELVAAESTARSLDEEVCAESLASARDLVTRA